VSSVTDMSYMFSQDSAFDQPIGTWDVTHVTDMSAMFWDAMSFNQPLDAWNLSKVTTLSRMFYGASLFNQTIGGWNVSSVTDMSYMFSWAMSFDQPIGTWDVTQVTDMSAMFWDARSFNQPLDAWNLSKVTTLSWMFCDALSFDQPLASWDLSCVTDMSYMFSGASSFDQPVSSWNVSGVRDMSYIFYDASGFNQNVGTWTVSRVTDMTAMFHLDTLSTSNYDSLLTGWATQTLQHNIAFDAGNSKYSSAAESARTLIISNFNWTITDGGFISSGPPSAPQNLAAHPGNSQVSLSWTAPANNGSSPITNYCIYMGASPGAETLLATIGNVTTYNATGLTNGQTYYFMVAAENAAGAGPNATGTNAAPRTVPLAPTGLAATYGNAQVSLTWNAPLSNGGSPITKYTIYIGISTGAETLLATIGNVTTYTVTGLTNGQTYYFTVSATNDAGEGAQSSEALATPAHGGGGPAPSYPVGLVFAALAAACAGIVVTLKRKPRS